MFEYPSTMYPSYSCVLGLGVRQVLDMEKTCLNFIACLNFTATVSSYIDEVWLVDVLSPLNSNGLALNFYQYSKIRGYILEEPS